jgi:hypothetical protein
MNPFAQTTIRIRTDSTAAFVALAVLYAIVLLACLIAFARIIRKAGYSPWWIFVALVPVVNVVMLFAFAFTTWPLERDAARRSAVVDAPPPPPPPGPRDAAPGAGAAPTMELGGAGRDPRATEELDARRDDEGDAR